MSARKRYGGTPTIRPLLLNQNTVSCQYKTSAYVDIIIDGALEIYTNKFSGQSIVSSINVPSNGKLHVIGDIRGDHDALFTYLNYIGTLSETNKVLFLGNIIGPGPGPGKQEWTCLLTVLQCFTRYPQHCTILKGHNECRSQSSGTGGMFCETDNETRLENIEKIFNLTPLCCKINNDIFACHSSPPMAVETENLNVKNDTLRPPFQ